MITKYYNFINESNQTENILKSLKIYKYKIDSINTIECNQDVDISFKNLYVLPLDFHTINGSFDCSHNKLTNLFNCPEIITKNFKINNNEITELYGCPEHIKGDFDCSDNLFTSLYGSPKRVDGNFRCRNSKVNDLNRCPQYVGKNFYYGKKSESIGKKIDFSIEDYPLSIIEGEIVFDDAKLSYYFDEICRLIKNNKEEFIPILDSKEKFHRLIMKKLPELIPFYRTISPEKTLTEGRISKKTPKQYGIQDCYFVDGKLNVDEYVTLNGYNFTKLPFQFGEIKGNFTCSHNKNLKNLIGCPHKVNNNFYVENNGITSLEGIPEIINGNIWITNNYNLPSFDYFPKKVNGFFFWDDDKIKTVEDYPLSIIDTAIVRHLKDNPEGIDDIHKLVKENEDIFKPLLNNKIGFHQMVMRLQPNLIKYYKTIPPPPKNTILFI